MTDSPKALIRKAILLVVISLALGFSCAKAGLNFQQCVSVTVFAMSILGTLFFWNFRLSFAFLGTSVLLITKAIDLEHVVKFASIEIILFLVGMMIIVGLLKEAGFFAWIVQLILRIHNLTAKKFVISVAVVSALMACAVDEVTSIIFMVAAVLEICDYYEIDPVPFVIISVLATNIGSAATVLGNPVGILIATKSGINFEDFLVHAFPVAAVCVIVLIGIVIFWYRKQIAQLDEHIKHLGANEILIKLISVPPDKHLRLALWIFGITLLFISLHHRLEILLGLSPNTILLVVPLISAAVIMTLKRERARYYVEREVEWWTLLFFMMLFAQAGTLKFVGVTDVLANTFTQHLGHAKGILSAALLWVASIGSSILDNVVLVAVFIPVVQSFQDIGFKIDALWWALLFGGCFGGNITMVGSTANIVALGILEKERNIHMTFMKWLPIGLVVGLITTIIAWVALTIM